MRGKSERRVACLQADQEQIAQTRYDFNVAWGIGDASMPGTNGGKAMRRLLPILLVLISACSSTPGTSDLATVAPDQAQRTPPWTQRFVDNAGVRIEYRVREVAGAGADRTPVVFIPGMSADASVWENNVALVGALDAAGPRKLVAVSLRGRGASDCPDHGWTPQDHQSDIAAVVRAEKLGRYHLVAHSMGVAYAVGFALSRPRDEIQSFIAADYPPVVFQVNEEWASMVESMQPPLTFDPRMPRRVARTRQPGLYRAPGRTAYADAGHPGTQVDGS